MAATRNKNSKGDYCLEQKQHRQSLEHVEYYNTQNGHAYTPAYPELYVQGYMPPDNFSFNPTDIESALFGIGSTNLVQPKPPTKPQFKSLPSVSFFNKPEVVKEKPFVPLLNQRPFICNTT
jgi:hypothetical protein